MLGLHDWGTRPEIGYKCLNFFICTDNFKGLPNIDPFMH